MLEQIKKRIGELAEMLEKSAANHNALVGAKTELESVYNVMISAAPEVEAVAAIVDPTQAPAIDAAISAVETVASAVESA